MTRAALRVLTPADQADALRLYATLTGDNPLGGAGAFQAVLDHSGTEIWGAELDGRIVSMATLHLMPNVTYSGRPYGLIENVVTLRSHQGRGLGRQVMQAVIAAAWEADAYKLMLLTGRHVGAKGFYEKLGFSDAGKHGMMLRRVPMRQAQV